MHTSRRCSTLAVAGLAFALGAAPAGAASHREAPLMTLDPAADITDVYAFMSYDAANLARAAGDRKATLILNVIPAQEPSSGPNYFAFDDNVLYEIHVDNDKDGDAEDVIYQVRFQTTVDKPDQFVATLALPPVTDLEGPNAAGMAIKQRYTVTELRNCKDKKKGPKCKDKTVLFGGQSKPAVPSNIGPRTMPDYAALAAKGIFTDTDTGIRVFAGQRAETFAIDLGAVFDTVNLRRTPLPVETVMEDANDAINPFGTNAFSGFNVNTIAIEVPAKRLTRDGASPSAANGTIGVYASTSRQQVTIRRGAPALNPKKPPEDLLQGAKSFRQVSRMANPLVNELIIAIGKKDLWNATDPSDEVQFLDFYRKLAVADALKTVSGVDVPPQPRDDIVHLLTQYADQDVSKGPFSELLRLDMTVPPTAPDSIKRLGPLAHDSAGVATPDPAGFPNGRRPNDDVTDLVVRVVGGQNYIDNRVGDGVHLNDKGITPDFPFLPTPYDGRDRVHKDPGE
ncbi:MAG: DUF4331 domain-containing protein [Deltaproteobacteria bacterium]|nr:MAG: DUF4331 domain-containing protein [Deltaproteobacteria bacterium]